MRRHIYFSGKTVNTTGEIFSSNVESLFLFHIYSSGLVTGAYVSIQAQSPLGQWGDLDNRNISSNGTTLVKYQGPLAQSRATISGYVDGNYSVSVDAE